jgi:hypothetical protein
MAHNERRFKMHRAGRGFFFVEQLSSGACLEQ